MLKWKPFAIKPGFWVFLLFVFKKRLMTVNIFFILLCDVNDSHINFVFLYILQFYTTICMKIGQVKARLSNDKGGIVLRGCWLWSNFGLLLQGWWSSAKVNWDPCCWCIFTSGVIIEKNMVCSQWKLHIFGLISKVSRLNQKSVLRLYLTYLIVNLLCSVAVRYTRMLKWKPFAIKPGFYVFLLFVLKSASCLQLFFCLE